MGAWSESITGNDTAEDLLLEYPAAFLKYEPEEAVSKIVSLTNLIRKNGATTFIPWRITCGKKGFLPMRSGNGPLR